MHSNLNVSSRVKAVFFVHCICQRVTQASAAAANLVNQMLALGVKIFWEKFFLEVGTLFERAKRAQSTETQKSNLDKFRQVSTKLDQFRQN